MAFPITSVGGNLAVGAIAGAAATAITEYADDRGVDTWGTIGLGLAIGVPAATITRGHFIPYMAGVLAGYGGYQLLTGND